MTARQQLRFTRPSGRALSLALALAISSCSTPEAQKSGADLLLKGLNTHRMVLTQGMLHQDITVFSDGQEIARGLDAVHSWLAWDSTLARRLSYDSLVVNHDTTWIRGAWMSGVDLALLGFAQIPLSAGSFLLHSWGGGVQEIHISSPLVTPSGDPVGKEAEFVAWASREYPQRLSRIRSPQGFHYSAAGAADWIALLREWVTAAH